MLKSSSDMSGNRVRPIELFFDLVFVFTITQLTHLLAEHLTLSGVVQTGLIFIVLYWMYGAYAWATNQVPPDRPIQQVLLVAGMAGFLICALAVPGAFGDQGVMFGLGYVWVVIVHSILYFMEYGRAVWRFAPVNLISGLMLILVGTVEGWLVHALWIAVILIQVVPSWLVRHSTRFDVQPNHFVERHGLLLVVAIGESVIAIGVAIDIAQLDADLAWAAVLSLALSACLWWVYFASDAERAEEMLASASSSERVRVALGGYFYAFILMLLGVIAMAAGITESLAHFTESLDPPVAFVLSGGVGLYLLGQVAFRAVLRIETRFQRLLGPLAAAATGFLGVHVTAAVELLTLVAVLLVVVLTDVGAMRQRPEIATSG